MTRPTQLLTLLYELFDVDSWADRTIINATAEAIDTISFTYPTQTIEVTNTPATTGEVYWRSTKPLHSTSEKRKD